MDSRYSETKLYHWLGADAPKVQWYADNYSGLALRMHLEQQFPDNTRYHLPTDKYR